jgi:hypothetical protein
MTYRRRYSEHSSHNYLLAYPMRLIDISVNSFASMYEYRIWKERYIDCDIFDESLVKTTVD